MKFIGKIILITFILATISLCGYELWNISEKYSSESKIKVELLKYRPKLPNVQDGTTINNDHTDMPAPFTDADLPDPDSEGTNQPAAPEKFVNQNIIDIQNEINSDIVGWLSIPNTQIDYPFVLAKDNDFYLRRDIYKKQATAGSIFMDYRCDKDFTDSNIIIYGHNMKNRSMFGDLRLFADPDFFEANTSAILFTENNTYSLEILAYMVVRFDDKMIYNPSENKDELFEYAKQNARRYRDPVSIGSFVTLSTCSYEYDGARMVLLAVIK